MKGRISVRVGQRLETGSVAWTRAEKEERLEIFTPFGSQIAEIVKNASVGVVMRKGGESVQADSVGELTADVLGVALDLDMIAAWTQGVGLVDGQAQSLSLPNGDTWLVTAERFQASGANRFVSRLTATRGDTVVRLVIDEWQPR
ncbi:MAG: outer membrane lipoprotein LolB [Betaproteobacteria bacterium]|nr:outer membrane lipoprotein LolB [Betaproteobacteria bacterium]